MSDTTVRTPADIHRQMSSRPPTDILGTPRDRTETARPERGDADYRDDSGATMFRDGRHEGRGRLMKGDVGLVEWFFPGTQKNETMFAEILGNELGSTSIPVRLKGSDGNEFYACVHPWCFLAMNAVMKPEPNAAPDA